MLWQSGKTVSRPSEWNLAGKTSPMVASRISRTPNNSVRSRGFRHEHAGLPSAMEKSVVYTTPQRPLLGELNRAPALEVRKGLRLMWLTPHWDDTAYGGVATPAPRGWKSMRVCVSLYSRSFFGLRLASGNSRLQDDTYGNLVAHATRMFGCQTKNGCGLHHPAGPSTYRVRVRYPFPRPLRHLC